MHTLQPHNAACCLDAATAASTSARGAPASSSQSILTTSCASLGVRALCTAVACANAFALSILSSRARRSRTKLGTCARRVVSAERSARSRGMRGGAYDAREHCPSLLAGDVQLRRRAVIRSRVVQDPGASGEGHLHDVFEHALASHSGDRVHLCRRRRGKLVRPQHLVVMLFN